MGFRKFFTRKDLSIASKQSDLWAHDVDGIKTSRSEDADHSLTRTTSLQALSESRLGPRWGITTSEDVSNSPSASSGLDVVQTFHGSHGLSPRPSESSKQDYWSLALQELQQENLSIAEALSKVQKAASVHGQGLLEALLAETECRRCELLEKKWKVKLGSKDVILRDQFEKIFKAIQIFQDLGSAAARLDPVHAGLPWAGICLLMQLSLNESDQYAAMVDGVKEVSTIISRYKHVETICQQRQDVALKDEFEVPLITLYKHILKYQVSVACFYQRNTILRFLRSIPKLDDVSDVLSEIRRSDSVCISLGQVFDTRDEQLRHYEIRTLFKTYDEKLETMSRDLQTLIKTKATAQGDVPEIPFAFEPDPKFTGREDLIEALDVGFKTYRRMALVGWAGVGKSQIAIEYAHRFRNHCHPSKTYWIRGARKDAFLKSYRDLARKLKLPHWDDPKTNIGELVHDWLCDPEHGRWLLVLDNVDDETVFCKSRARQTEGEVSSPDGHLQNYIPQVAHGCILITSRNRTAARDLVNEDDCIISVACLPDTDAMSLLHKKLPKDKSSEQDVKELVAELENLPLAITQAAAYISAGSTRMTISRYMQLFRSDPVRYLELAAEDIRRDSTELDQDFSNSALKTWFISFKHIKEQNPDAAETLCIISLLHGQGIPVEYLLCGQEVDYNEVEDCIRPLIQFSLISEEAGGLTFSIHRLVQLSVQNWLRSIDELTNSIELALSVVSRRFPHASTETDNWKTCEVLMPHVEAVLRYDFPTLVTLELASLLLVEIAAYLSSRGYWTLALERASRAHHISTENLSLFLHQIRFSAELQIINAHNVLGNADQSEKLARSLAADARHTLGEEHPRTIRAIERLGVVLLTCGKYEESELETRRALRLMEGSPYYGSEANDTMACLAMLGVILQKRGRFQEARAIHLDSIARNKKSNGEMHISTLEAIINYSVLLIQMGDYEAAQPLLYATYLKKVQLLTEDYPSTLSTLCIYVLVLVFQRKFSEAQKWNVQCLQLTRELDLPDWSLLSLQVLHNQCLIDGEVSNSKEEKKNVEKLVQMRSKHLGDKHPDTLDSIHLQGEYEMNAGNYIGAESIFKHTLQSFREQLGEDLHTRWRLSLTRQSYMNYRSELGMESWETIRTQVLLARVLFKKSKSTKAAELLATALEMATKAFGEDSVRTLEVKHYYATFLGAARKTGEEAISIFRQLLKQYRNHYDSTDSDVLRTRGQLAIALCILDKFSEAEHLCRESVDLCLQKFGELSHTTCQALACLAHVLLQQWSFFQSSSVSQAGMDSSSSRTTLHAEQLSHRQESLRLCQKVVELNSTMFGLEAEQTLTSKRVLADYLSEADQNEQALIIAQEVLDTQKRSFGSQSIETLRSSRLLAEILSKMQRFSEAEVISYQTWQSMKTILGEDHIDTMAMIAYLAFNMSKLKKPGHALKLHEELLEQQTRLFGIDAVEVLQTMDSIAVDYFELKDYHKAERFMKQVITGLTAELGLEHRMTLSSSSMLGCILIKLDRWTEAEHVFRETYHLEARQLGCTHKHTINTLNAWIDCLRELSKHDEVLLLQQQVLQDFKIERGATHADTLEAMRNLALGFQSCKDFLQAERVYREYFQLTEKTPAHDSVDELRCIQDFGRVLFELGNFAEAEIFSRKAYDGLTNFLGPEDEGSLLNAWFLTRCLVNQQKLFEAELVARTVLALEEPEVARSRHVTFSIMQQLSSVLVLQKRPQEAITVYEILLRRIEEVDCDDKLKCIILKHLLDLTIDIECYEAAQGYGRKLLQIQETTHGADSLELVSTLEMTAVLAYKMGRFQDAEMMCRRAMTIKELHSKSHDEVHMKDV